MPLPSLRAPRKPAIRVRVKKVIPIVATYEEAVAYPRMLDQPESFEFESVAFPDESRFFGIQPSFFMDDTDVYFGNEDGRTALYRYVTGRNLLVTQPESL